MPPKLPEKSFLCNDISKLLPSNINDLYSGTFVLNDNKSMEDSENLNFFHKKNSKSCLSDIENFPGVSEMRPTKYECIKSNSRSNINKLHTGVVSPLKIRKMSPKSEEKFLQNDTDSDDSGSSKSSGDYPRLCYSDVSLNDSLEDGEEFNFYNLVSRKNEKENMMISQIEESNSDMMNEEIKSPISNVYYENQKDVDVSAVPRLTNGPIEANDFNLDPLKKCSQSDSDLKFPQNNNISKKISSQCTKNRKRNHEVNEKISKKLDGDEFSSSDEIVEVIKMEVVSSSCSESESFKVRTRASASDEELGCRKLKSDISESENMSSNEDCKNLTKIQMKRQKKKSPEENNRSESSAEEDERDSTQESAELFVSTPRTAKFQKQYENSDDNVTPKMGTKMRRNTRLSAKKLSFGTENPQNIQCTPKTMRLSSRILHSPRVNVNTLTPTMAARRTPHRTPTTPKDHARVALSLFSAPESLPCREKEFKRIYEFLRDKINSRTSGFLGINGVPGTGKTATVERVIKKLSSEYEKDEKNKFETVEINGKQLIHPKEVYRQIWKQLTGNLTDANTAQKLLSERFQTKKFKKRRPVVLLIDEFDCLLNKKQDVRVIYRIVEWQIEDNSQLTIVAIANTLDFFEKKKLFSRMKHDSILFSAYTYRELQRIVSDRLKGNDIFAPEAVEFVARKVAGISGDARRALNICKSILDMVPPGQESDFVITISHATKMLQKIFDDPIIITIRTCARLEKLLLRAVRDILFQSGLPDCNLWDGVYRQLKAICALENLERPHHITACNLVQQLADLGLLNVNERPVSLHTKISLAVEPDAIRMALSKKG